MTKRTIHEELEAMRLPELQAMFAEVTGAETRAPNRKWLTKKIREALAAGESLSDAAPKKTAKAPRKKAAKKAKAEADARDDGEPKLSKLDVPALQAKYLEVIGRETRSTSKNYLVWRIRQAEKGLVPIGPRRGRASNGEAIPHKVLPIRIPAAAVPSLDEAWRRLGLKSRTEFFRIAVHSYLDGAGERDVAVLFAADA